MATQLAAEAWEAFAARFRWRQGEHVSLIGATGRGKTTLGMRLCTYRKATVVWSPKPSDPTVDRFVNKSKWAKPTADKPYRLIETWPPNAGDLKVVLRPKVKRLDEALTVRRAVFHQCASEIMLPKVGHWCVFADDTYYLSDILGGPVRDDLVEIWAMGRSHGVSLVAGIQRPAYVPLLAYQATHLFFWREQDHRNLKRISEIGVEDSALVTKIVQRLDAHRREVLYVNTFTGELAIVDLLSMGK